MREIKRPDAIDTHSCHDDALLYSSKFHAIRSHLKNKAKKLLIGFNTRIRFEDGADE